MRRRGPEHGSHGPARYDARRRKSQRRRASSSGVTQRARSAPTRRVGGRKHLVASGRSRRRPQDVEFASNRRWEGFGLQCSMANPICHDEDSAQQGRKGSSLSRFPCPASGFESRDPLRGRLFSAEVPILMEPDLGHRTREAANAYALRLRPKVSEPPPPPTAPALLPVRQPLRDPRDVLEPKGKGSHRIAVVPAGGHLKGLRGGTLATGLEPREVNESVGAPSTSSLPTSRLRHGKPQPASTGGERVGSFATSSGPQTQMPTSCCRRWSSASISKVRSRAARAALPKRSCASRRSLRRCATGRDISHSTMSPRISSATTTLAPA
jgi:hypothetical protein